MRGPSAATPNSSNTSTPVTHHCDTPEGHEAPFAKSLKVVEIPSIWTEHTQRCLNEKRVDPDVRKEIVCTMTAAPEVHCERVANSIVIKYSFLADPYGPTQSVGFFLRVHYKF